MFFFHCHIIFIELVDEVMCKLSSTFTIIWYCFGSKQHTLLVIYSWTSGCNVWTTKI